MRWEMGAICISLSSRLRALAACSVARSAGPAARAWHLCPAQLRVGMDQAENGGQGEQRPRLGE